MFPRKEVFIPSDENFILIVFGKERERLLPLVGSPSWPLPLPLSCRHQSVLMVQTLKLGGNKRNEQLRNAIKAQISIFVERVHGAEAFGAGQSRTSSKGRRGKVADGLILMRVRAGLIIRDPSVPPFPWLL